MWLWFIATTYIVNYICIRVMNKIDKKQTCDDEEIIPLLLLFIFSPAFVWIVIPFTIYSLADYLGMNFRFFAKWTARFFGTRLHDDNPNSSS